MPLQCTSDVIVRKTQLIAYVWFRWVQSETGNKRAVAQGLEKAPVTLKASVEGILDEIARMAPGKDAGFRTFDHGNIAW